MVRARRSTGRANQRLGERLAILTGKNEDNKG
jgi:hypothetical protein